ncbi:hypothetical protein PHMEG_00040035 [Phytophthora megakarya]|uniref:RNase H type-1 domain-containing protein n=1 Tax=Phytophthora megakarya TaxID=4795 RepID=A0A225UER0_9STRA|nr:hypothetical protein PHMEG_00040035 [Phytophthora megakarya]
MLAVLGPRSINEDKFSEWCTEIVALGLLWNTVRRTVSIPNEKVVKARLRVEALLKLGTASKTELNKVLGSLRHVAICLRAAKPFYQRLQGQSTKAPRLGRIRMSRGATADLFWFQQILQLGCLAELPLAMFGTLPTPDVVLLMDASDSGLAVLDPASNEFIQLKFDQDEEKMVKEAVTTASKFSINVREHLCIALALWTWGSKWNQQAGKLIHIKCWSDNMSAVSWCNKLHSKNSFSQEINRYIGLAEAYFNLRVSVDHIPGARNSMADAASRAWTEPHKSRWSNFSSCWNQVPIPPNCRKLYTNFSSSFKPNHWPRRPQQSTTAHGHNGLSGASGSIFLNGCLKT